VYRVFPRWASSTVSPNDIFRLSASYTPREQRLLRLVSLALMKAIVYSSYGGPDVLQMAEVEKPVPGRGEMLIRVRAASVNPLDWHAMRGSPFLIRLGSGLRKPQPATRLGADLAGVVEAAGAGVTQFQPGDEVFGACRGALAEYVCAAEDKLAHKPANISFEQAAAVPVAGITALQGLRDKGRIRQGQRVVIDGASGGVGAFAVQIAKSFGAEVTAVCSAGKMDTARSLGADHVVDYTREDFTRTGLRYDLIVAANAYHSVFDYWRALNPGGTYVMAGGGGAQVLQALLLGPILSALGSKRMRFFIGNLHRKDLLLLKELLEAGKIAPVMDRRYAFSDTAEAVRYLEEGHARGKVVVTM